MKHVLKIDQTIRIDETMYRIIGIDTYELINIYGEQKNWASYTLVAEDNKENRIWLGHGFAGDYLIKQWIISEEEFKQTTAEAPFNAAYTGIANITFEGAQGYSVPHSEVIWYDAIDKDYDFLVIERFLELESDRMKTSKSYYHMMKILKNISF